MTITAETTMQDLLGLYPGAQRALFRHYHIGGCASCGFQPDETLAAVCARNDGLNTDEVIQMLWKSQEQDEKLMIEPTDAAAAMKDENAAFVDIRTREEFEAVHIEGALLFSQEMLQEIMGTWPKDRLIVIVDHQGARSMDGAAYFAGHGFTNVKSLHGGIDAWSQQVNRDLPRYTLE